MKPLLYLCPDKAVPGRIVGIVAHLCAHEGSLACSTELDAVGHFDRGRVTMSAELGRALRPDAPQSLSEQDALGFDACLLLRPRDIDLRERLPHAH